MESTSARHTLNNRLRGWNPVPDGFKKVIPAKNRRVIPSLTGLRGVAAWLVVIAHTDGHFAALQPAWLEYGWRVCANLGMTTFFTLSGFVIHYNYGPSISAAGLPAVRSFLGARFARLYPLYLLAFLISSAISPMQFHSGIFNQVWPRYLTLTQDWTPTIVNGALLTTLFIGGAWSISAEIALYGFYLLSARAMTALTTTRAFCAMATLTIAGLVFFGGYAGRFWLGDLDQQGWWLSLSPWCRVPEFLLGALCAQLYVQVHTVAITPSQTTFVRWIGAAGAIWIVCAFLLCYRYIYVQAAFNFAPGIAAVMFCLASCRSRASALVENPPALAIGEASYSVYMLHGFVLYLVMQGDYPSIPLAIFRIAIAWALISFLSLGVYRYFEAPARRFIKAYRLPAVLRTSLKL
jgi:peptidoglycan/LPS O-acetylase OafA/YrhL